MLRFAVLAVAVALCAAMPHHHYPAALTDDAEIDALLAADAEQAHGGEHKFPLRFNVPLDEEFGATVFLAQSESMEPPQAAGNADQPVMCETICRPMNETEQLLAGAAGVYAKHAGNPEEGAEGKAVKQTVESEGAPTMLMELTRKVCTMHGGKFVDTTGECEPFMRTTTAAVQYDGEAIFSACQSEHGSSYVPCNPYQALALAHMFEVPDHAYYWLWPGGRSDQVSQAVFKQEVGHNPHSGMDKCKEGHHVGFFHNWDQAHVDSWGCLQDSSTLPVLCCRRN